MAALRAPEKTATVLNASRQTYEFDQVVKGKVVKTYAIKGRHPANPDDVQTDENVPKWVTDSEFFKAHQRTTEQPKGELRVIVAA